MAEPLRINIITDADTKGFKAIGDAAETIKGAFKGAGDAAAFMGAALGAAIPTTLGGAVSAVSNLFVELVDKQVDLANSARNSALQLADLGFAMRTGALNAKTFADAVAVGVTALNGMSVASSKLRDAQLELGKGPSFLATTIEMLSTIAAGKDITPFTNDLKAAVKEFQNLEEATRLGGIASEKFAENVAHEQEQLRQLPAAEGIHEVLIKITELSEKVKSIDPTKSIELGKAWLQAKVELAGYVNTLDFFLARQNTQTTALRTTEEQIRLNNLAGQREAMINEQVAQAIEHKRVELIAQKVPQQQATEEADKFGKSVRKSLEVGLAAEKFHTFLREAQTDIQAIRQEEQLIADEPFMGVDEKQKLLLQSYASQMQHLIDLRDQLNAKKLALTDPLQIAQANRAIQNVGFQMRSLAERQAAAMHPLLAELSQWAQGFGSMWSQVGKTIEGSLTASFQSLNQYLLTGQFNAKALVTQIANLGLQLLENLAIQQVMALFSKQRTTESAAEGATIAAANAPGAAAKSIAQYGPIVGAAAALAAIAAIIAAIVIAHEGGPIQRRRRMHDGGLAEDEVPIIAQQGEFMVRRSVAQRPGMMGFLHAINSMHSGGSVASYDNGGMIQTDFGPMEGIRAIPYDPFGGIFDISPGIVIRDPTGVGAPGGGGPGGFGEREFRRGAMAFRFGPQAVSRALHESGFNRLFAAMRQTVWNPNLGRFQNLHYSPLHYTPAGSLTYLRPSISGRGVSRGVPMRQSFHSGGSIGGGGGTSGGGGAGIHIYAFTDLRALTRHMASKEGQKIIFDTVRGRRIDLGMT